MDSGEEEMLADVAVIVTCKEKPEKKLGSTIDTHTLLDLSKRGDHNVHPIKVKPAR
jgi:hypothetical protein